MVGHYLMFSRNCEEALKLYETAFDAKTTGMQKYGDMPPNPAFPIPEADKDLVLNARIVIDGAEIMCADSAQRGASGDNMYVSVTSGEALVQKAWDALSEGGEVYMELAPSFFAALHGSLKDKFGINWMFTAMK